MAPFLQLILGGARSGKSRFALAQGNERGFTPKTFLATASPGDEEMRSRIDRHRQERTPDWKTLEEPYALRGALVQAASRGEGLVVVDCATLWISNLLCGMGGQALSPADIEKEFTELFRSIPSLQGTVRIVSNEVGLGLVPENPLGRQFRDLQGTFNQGCAAAADQVLFLTAGIVQRIK